jgi:signal transduction histidine kinase/ActR/RegA family two-component response regulator
MLHRGFGEHLLLLETMSSAAHVGGWSIDKRSKKLFWTPQTFAIHKHPEDQPITREAALLYYPESVREQIEQMLLACLDQGVPFETEVPLIDAARKDRWVRVIGYPLVNDGQIHGAYGSIQDITEARGFREEMAAKREEAERFRQARTEFISAIGHELNTPLNGMLGMLESALHEQDAERQKVYLDKAFASTKALHCLVANVLDMAEVTSGEVGLNLDRIDIREVVRGVVRSFEPQALHQGKPIVATFDPALPKLADADATKLEQVLGHLISNALTFAVDGGIEIHTQTRYRVGREELWIEVSDQGPGIPEHRWRDIFIPFSQLKRHQSSPSAGVGLGLAICKSLVELMQGEIGLRRNQTGGSTFWFSVPIRHARNRLSAIDTNLIEPIGSGRVLIADDNAVNQLVLSSMMNRLGFNVVLANNGQQAADEAMRGEYDLLLIDLQMPDLSGTEVTAQVRQKWGEKAPPIVIVTADTSEAAKQSAQEAGAASFLTKPVSIERLRAVVGETVGSSAKPPMVKQNRDI